MSVCATSTKIGLKISSHQKIVKNRELRTSRAFANFTSGKFTFRRFQQGIYVWGAGFVFPVRNSSEYSLVHVHIGVTSYHRYGREKIDKRVSFKFFSNYGPIKHALVSILMGIFMVFRAEMYVLEGGNYF